MADGTRALTGTTDTPTTADDDFMLVASNAAGCAVTLTTTGWTAGQSMVGFSATAASGGISFVAGAGVTLVPASPTIAAGEQGLATYVAAGVWFVATEQTALEIRARLLTVDGAGSGIDADLLDGQHASAFEAAGAASSAIAAHVAAADPHPTYLTAAEGNAAYQPLDADLTTIAAANNGSVLAATTASFTTADETKLDGLVSNATHTGDVTGATALTIANDAVTNAKAANMAANTIKGRVTAGTGDPEDLTPAQARTVIASDSGGGTTNFLRADGTWAAPAGASDLADNLASSAPSGEFVCVVPALWNLSWSSISLSSNLVNSRSTAHIIRCVSRLPIDQISFWVQTAQTDVAGAKARLAIFSSTNGGSSGTLVSDLGEVTIDTTGLKSLALPANRSGEFWIGFALTDHGGAGTIHPAVGGAGGPTVWHPEARSTPNSNIVGSAARQLTITPGAWDSAAPASFTGATSGGTATVGLFGRFA